MSRPVTNIRRYGKVTGFSNPSSISKKQQRLFFSEGSPLTEEQKERLRKEIRSGKVTIK